MPEFVQLSHFDTAGSAWCVRRKERVPAPPERVWRAIVEPKELCKWWCDEVAVDLRVGGRYAFSGPHVFAGAADAAIVDFVENERFVYRWRIDDVETEVRYDLTNVLELTELTVTQTAERSPAWPGAESGPNWWWTALPALRAHIETGAPDLRIDFESSATAPVVEFGVNVYTFPWIIWDKLTNPPQMNRWWAKDARVEPNPGGVFDLGGAVGGPSCILELEPERRLVHDWHWCDETTSRVSWSLVDTDEATRVNVRDEGPWPSSLRRDQLAIHWASWLLNLKQMSQRGVTPMEYQE